MEDRKEGVGCDDMGEAAGEQVLDPEVEVKALESQCSHQSGLGSRELRLLVADHEL